MSFFGSLHTSASGMLAQSKATAVISTNIANVTTTGFKRSDNVFHDLVADSRYGTGYINGAVQADRILRTAQQGAIQSTFSRTDAAISGNGFFAVSTGPDIAPNDSNIPSNMFYTRNGQFSEVVVPGATPADERTFLANSAGFFLYGYPYDPTTGTISADTSDFSQLVPVELSTFQSLPLPTTELDISLNVNAGAEVIDRHLASGGPQTLPTAGEEATHARSFTVFDQLGNPQELLFEYRKIVGPMAHFTTQTGSQFTNDTVILPASGLGSFSGVNNGDQFTMTVGGVSETYTFVDETLGDDLATNQIATIGGLIAALNEHGTDPLAVPPVTEGLVEARVVNGRLLVQADDPSVTIDLSETIGTPLSGINSLNIIEAPGGGLSYAPEEDLANPVLYPDQGDFPAFANITDPVAQNWWELTIINPADGSAIRQGLLNFDENGGLNATPDANGRITVDLATTPIDFDGDPTTEPSAITVDLTRISQFDAPFQVIASEQNGAGVGTLREIELTEDGRVVGIFSNDVRTNLYQIPLIMFSSPENLNDESGTVFSVTENSGAPRIEFTGQGGAGQLQVAAIEGSTVDIADEFSHLIVAQRGFSMNSQVIQAVDEMTERLGQL